MKKGLTELVFIIDRSGSMHGLEKDTIGGFNAMIDQQKKADGEANVTTVFFDDHYEVIHDRFPLDAVKPITEQEYFTRGCTALLDAIGRSVAAMVNTQKHLPEEYRAEKVIFMITTDGYENASREYDYAKVRRMIEQQKEKYGWEFLFLGANIDAVSEARKFGISEDRAVEYNNDKIGVELNYRCVSKAMTSMRDSGGAAPMGKEWKEAIEQDRKTRGSRRH